MININFKPCCQDCTVIDVEVETATLVQSGEKHVKIHCAHDVVCGRFNKSDNVTEIKVKKFWQQ